jgi:hypothetical protein
MPEATPESIASEAEGLRAALKAWVDDASSQIAANAATLLQMRSVERWQLGDDGNYRRTTFTRHLLTHHGVGQLKRLPSRAAALRYRLRASGAGSACEC